MKEFEVTVRVRNNRLKERREALGMTQPEFARAVGVSLGAYRELESLRRSPRHQDGRWRAVVFQLAHFHCVEPEELFPQAALAVETPVATRRISGDEIFSFLSTHQQRLLEAPDAAHDRAELREQVRRVLATLPPRDAEILRLRFGLDDGVERTTNEAAAELDLGRAGVWLAENRAIRRMRRPTRSARIKAFTR